jgi:hypothetical protein
MEGGFIAEIGEKSILFSWGKPPIFGSKKCQTRALAAVKKL